MAVWETPPRAGLSLWPAGLCRAAACCRQGRVHSSFRLAGDDAALASGSALRRAGGGAAEGQLEPRPQRGLPEASAKAALRAGLVDECGLIVALVVVGGGTAWLLVGPRLGLETCDERCFAGGMVYLRYRIRA